MAHITLDKLLSEFQQARLPLATSAAMVKERTGADLTSGDDRAQLEAALAPHGVEMIDDVDQPGWVVFRSR